MNTLQATFKIVTPMFISGADQTKAELRGPSIKGVLRFWWRALNWSRVFRQVSNNERQAIHELRREESLIFGSANSGKGEGQSAILLEANSQPALITAEAGDDLLNGKASQYLAMGLFKMGECQQRYAVPAETIFSLKIVYKNINSAQQEQLIQTIKAIGLWGGFGSRSRNGFGSLAILSLNNENFFFDNQKQYLDAVERLIDLKTRCNDKPSFTAFSKQTDMKTLPVQLTFEQALDSLAIRYRDFRINHTHDQRKKYFGLPLNSYDIRHRRASPLFFHIHPIGSRFLPVVIKIPAYFHPQYSVEDYSLVDDFMSTL